MRGEGGRSSLTDDDTNDPTYHPSEEEESEGEGRPPSTVRYECGEEAKTTFEKIYEDKPGFIPYLPRVLVGVGPKGGVRIVTPGGYAYRVDESGLYLRWCLSSQPSEEVAAGPVSSVSGKGHEFGGFTDTLAWQYVPGVCRVFLAPGCFRFPPGQRAGRSDGGPMVGANGGCNPLYFWVPETPFIGLARYAEEPG